MKTFGPLQPGDRVALIATASPVPDGQDEKGVELLTRWGLDVVVYDSVTTPHPRASYLSGPDALRAGDLQNAWCDPDNDAIMSVRGGYGTVRLLDRLDRQAMRAVRPKPFFGSSDLTALHQWIADEIGVMSWHTPMPGSLSVLDDEAAQANLREAVFEPWKGREFGPSCAETMVEGTAQGRLIGGCLSLLAQTLGARTRRPIDNRGTIVLLEDVGEATYKYDGYLTSLLRAGYFDGVQGIALGSWAQSNEDEVRALVEEMLIPLGLPMIWNLGFGHCDGAICVPLGVQATLTADARPRLTLG